MAHHLVGDVGDGADRRGDRAAGIDQRVDHDFAPVAVHHDHRDLGDPVARARPHAGGFHVDDREGAIVQHGGALRLGDQAPAAIDELAHPGVRSQQRDGDPVADRGRRTSETHDPLTQHARRAGPVMEQLQHPFHQRALRVSGEAGHTGSRSSGSDMQRGPPPPRASSAPSTVITVRCLASVQSSKARKLTAGTMRNPAFCSSQRVASFRR